MLTDEERFLLRVLTDPFNQGLNNRSDIENFYKLIEDYLLFAFVYLRLSKEGNFGIPQRMRKELKKNYLLNLRMGLKVKSQTLKIIDIFNKEKISSLLLKGPLLGERIYQKEGLRPASKGYRPAD